MTAWDGLQSGIEFMMLERFKVDQKKLRHYAWASGDYNPIHFDDASAKSMGLPSTIMHGMFELGLMAISLDELTDQIFKNALVKCQVKKIETKFVGAALLNDELSISAKIAATSEDSFTLHMFMYRNGDRALLTALGSAVLEAINTESF